jgi:hypothetical protein
VRETELKEVGSGTNCKGRRGAGAQEMGSRAFKAGVLTNIRHLGHCGMVGPEGKYRWIVVDVLYFDDEL